jgi:hypothetical protein
MKGSSCVRRIAVALMVIALACLLPCERASAQSGAGILRGTITDPSGAAVAGAKVTATSSTGQPSSATSNVQGEYEIRGLAPGTYDVKVSAAGFQDFENPHVKIVAGAAQALDVPLAIPVEKQQVSVSDTAPTLEVSPEKNAGAIALKGADLNALSDDPDQLQQDLQALAGPASGPNGGEMYVNGFTAGQLPPKSSIREIRINQNPFSSEYDQVGFGRIEILTKPGTDSLHGSGFLWGNNQSLNTWSPFVPPTITTAGGQTINGRPGYYMLLYEGDISGSLNKRTSFSADVSRRYINQLETGAVLDSSTLAVTPGALAVSNPRPRITVSGSVQYEVTPNNTFTALYQYWGNNEKNDGISTYSLPSQGYNAILNEHQVQLTDTQIFHDTIVNETRFQYLRDYVADKPQSTGFAFSAPNYVSGGGSPAGATTDVQNHYEFQNYTTIVKGKHTVKFGARLRDASEWNSSLAMSNGVFTFASGATWVDAETALQQGDAVPVADYPIAFALGVGSPVATANIFDAGLYVQDDWQLRPNLTLSGGMRFETQSGIPDHADYAPRAAIAWGVGKTKAGAPRTVLRGGWGIFYNRFPLGNLLNANRFNGVSQVSYTVENPDFFPNVPTAAELAGEPGSSASLPTLDTISRSLHTPYTMQSAATVEQQLFSGTTLTVNYINARGVHQPYTTNINTPLPGTFDAANPQAAAYPFGYNAGYIDEYQSGGIFKQNQMIVNLNSKAGKYLSLYSYYVFNYASGTTTGLLSDYYDPSLDYGRASFDIRNRAFSGGEVNLKYGFEVDIFLVYASGQPFNITSGTNLYGTSSTAQNSRPSFTNLPADPPTPSDPNHVETVFASPWGNLFNGLPGPGEKVIPFDLGTGSRQFYTNMGIGKTFNFGPKPETPTASDSNSASTASPAKPVGRYSLDISAYARNAFNQVSYGARVSALDPPSAATNFVSDFLQPVGLAVPIPANRQVFLYARFSF